ncbi:ArsR/SmtB family transcription factor, partial [Anaerococcus nagyae]|uniref:ArsR/SmtB family transcription factor n=1 Tax=Anaerococcus nagyae TaxID=1755241 RepID=UPI003734D8C3
LSLDMSQSAISHQLKYLKDASLVKCQREGKLMLYSLADNHIKIIFKTGIEHINE